MPAANFDPLPGLPNNEVMLLKQLIVSISQMGGGEDAVSSVFGRTGAVVAVNGDYTAAQVTNAASLIAANVFSANGAASTPAMLISGTPFDGGSGTTTLPLVLVRPAGAAAITSWETTGTALGLVLPNASGGDYLALFRNGVRFGTIDVNGYLKGFDAALLGNIGLQCFTNATNAFTQDSSQRTVLLSHLATGLRMSSGYQLAWSASAAGAGDAFSSLDLILVRDGAGILAQKNSTNPQEQRIYGTTTGNKYLSLSHNGTNAVINASSGNLLISSLPTSNPGPGILWNNTGIPAIGT